MSGLTQNQSVRIMHTMLRVTDLERSLAFYTGPLGMTLFRTEDYPEGRFTLVFLGYGSEATSAVIELTHNWDTHEYASGNAYGHIALSVLDAAAACGQLEALGVKIVRPAAPMTFASPDRTTPEVIAFIEDPDGYRIELIETGRSA
jgi:lactoylglutathione lyase